MPSVRVPSPSPPVTGERAGVRGSLPRIHPAAARAARRGHTVGMTSERANEWLVACLCAQWCGSCRDYRAVFEALAREHPALRFVWVDIEDESDALAPFDLDIENFPTVLVACGDELRFLGTLLPHAATLARTIAAARHAVLTEWPRARGAALAATVGSVGQAVSEAVR